MSQKNQFYQNLRLAEISDFDNLELIPLQNEADSELEINDPNTEFPILPIRNIVLVSGDGYTHYGG